MLEVGRQAKEPLQISRQEMIMAWIKLIVVKTVRSDYIRDFFYYYFFLGR